MSFAKKILDNTLFTTPPIKFTHEISNTTISFLDTSSSLTEGEQSTDLYSKHIDTKQNLLSSSCHPRVTKSIPYSQALRIKRHVSQTVWLFESNHGRLRKVFLLFGFFRRIANAHEWCWSCFSESGGMWGHNERFLSQHNYRQELLLWRQTLQML
jgi:hypothetical protein